MAAVMRSSVPPLLLAVLSLLALFPGAERLVDVMHIEVGLNPGPHLRNLAASGSNLEAFHAAVEANAQDADALLDVSSDLAMPKMWPKIWSGKLGKAKAVGRGAFGLVFVVPLKCSPGAEVAVKKINTTNETTVLKEVAGLRAFSHPNIITYVSHGKGSDGKAYYVMMEAASGGDLRKQLPSDHAGALFLGILRGVKAMHDKSVVHRDLKPENVLVSKNCRGSPPCTAKVADLGLACSMPGASRVEGIPLCQGFAGTPIYIAPETYSQGIVAPSNDMWALGLILWELSFGQLPGTMQHYQNRTHLESEIQGLDISSDRSYRKLSKHRLWLIEGMLNLDHKQRLSAAGALEIAEAWGNEKGWSSTASGEMAKLPECLKQEVQLRAASDEEDEEDEEPDIAPPVKRNEWSSSSSE